MNAHFQDKRVWLGGGAVFAVLILLIGWFFVIDPELSAAASTRDEAESAQAQNVVMDAKNNALQAQQENIASLQANLQDLSAGLPADDGLPAFTRQLSEQAGTSVVLTSIIVGAVGPVAAAVPATESTGETENTSEAGTTAVPDATPAASTTLVQMTITVAAAGLGDDLVAFVQKIQTGPRRVLVTDSQLTPSGDAGAGIAGQCTMNMTLTIFSAPQSPEAEAALAELLSGN